jgi:hypothetical protein
MLSKYLCNLLMSQSSLRDEFVSALGDIGLPRLSPDIQLTLPVNLYGLPSRVTGAESMYAYAVYACSIGSLFTLNCLFLFF